MKSGQVEQTIRATQTHRTSCAGTHARTLCSPRATPRSGNKSFDFVGARTSAFGWGDVITWTRAYFQILLNKLYFNFVVAEISSIGWRVADRVLRVQFAAEDRKSTRLNSSHPSISYAVFWLK